MLSDAEKLEFFEGLCQELQSKSLDKAYSAESELKQAVVEVVRSYVESKPYRDEVNVWEDNELIEKVNAFGRECCPDIAIEVSRQTLVAIELKLLREYWGLARGIEQAIIDSARYDYIIIFALDKRKFHAEKHESDAKISSELWNKHKIKVIS